MSIASTSPSTKNSKSTRNTKSRNSEEIYFKCSCCGHKYDTGAGNFYLVSSSPLYDANDGRVTLCMECVEKIYKDLKNRFGDEKIAVMTMCHYLDTYFDESQYETMKSNAKFTLGIYIRSLGLRQNKNKTFLNTILELMTARLRDKTELREEIEDKWKKEDKNNKNFCISSIGYDCFDDTSYTNMERKYLFNVLSDYLTDDVLEDAHKVQAVINMAKTNLQIDKLNKLLNATLKDNGTDCTKIDKLSSSIGALTRMLNTTANENGLTAKSNGKSNKGSNSLTHIMKEMQENNFEECKVNVLESKLSKSYQEIAEFNARALMKELSLTGDEYALMASKQSEQIRELQKSNEKFQEENRKLKLKIKLETEKNNK